MTWRTRLYRDKSTAAHHARLALSAVRLAEPSYYDKAVGHHEGYRLERERAAVALWRWRSDEGAA